MRLRCYGCGKSVSDEVPPETTVRAVLFCPECIERAGPGMDVFLKLVQAWSEKPAGAATPAQ